MAEVRVNPGTLPNLGVRIRGIRERLANLDPILKRRAALLSTLIDESFRNSRSPTGEGWRPLANSTVEKRRRGSSKPLVDTGQLRAASFARAKGQRSIVFGTSGAPATYGVFHITGTSNMPRRGYLPMNENGRPDFSGGPAADWLAKTEADVINYVLHDRQ